MNLDVLLWQLQFGNQELRHLDSLVALHLDDLTQLGVLDDVAVTGKVLLQNLQNLLQVIFIRNTLNGGQGLTTVTLLNTDMDVVCGLSFGITSVGEWVWG